MALGRDDRWVADALGRALAGAQVYWCTQPASTVVNPPNPLAPIYTDLTGDTPIVQPVLSDGFGHAWAYLEEGVLFTVVIWHPLFGSYPIVIPDQILGGGSGSVTVFAGTPTGTIDGTNRVFTVVNGSTPLTALPTQITAWLNFPLIEGLGYSLAVTGGQLQITYATAPQPASGGGAADAIYAQGIV
jgi:hypothetical protein